MKQVTYVDTMEEVAVLMFELHKQGVSFTCEKREGVWGFTIIPEPVPADVNIQSLPKKKKFDPPYINHLVRAVPFATLDKLRYGEAVHACADRVLREHRAEKTHNFNFHDAFNRAQADMIKQVELDQLKSHLMELKCNAIKTTGDMQRQLTVLNVELDKVSGEPLKGGQLHALRQASTCTANLTRLVNSIRFMVDGTNKADEKDTRYDVTIKNMGVIRSLVQMTQSISDRLGAYHLTPDMRIELNNLDGYLKQITKHVLEVTEVMNEKPAQSGD